MTPAHQFETAMRRALELAGKGPVTGGNPQVGAVLLAADGSIVAEGWHHGAGTDHAEVSALSQLAMNPATGAPDARGLTAVVTLEPCNHTGRTGPCSGALIAAGIERVVFAVADPSARADGGAERLRAAGVEVVEGVLGDETSGFLHAWLTATRLGRPYVTLKWAASLDGRAAAADGTSQWITGTAARQRVHEQRAQSDAIIIGTGTALADDPSLTARGDGGELLPHQPLPVVIGRRGIPTTARLRESEFVEARTHDLPAVLSELFDRDVRRAYVEGGPTLASSFIAAGLVDEYAIYLAPKLIGGPRLAVGDVGVRSIGDALALHITTIEPLGDDLLIVARPVARPKE